MLGRLRILRMLGILGMPRIPRKLGIPGMLRIPGCGRTHGIFLPPWSPWCP
jgi:hypothetical protein